MKTQSLKLVKPDSEMLDFESLSELASWTATNALQTLWCELQKKFTDFSAVFGQQTSKKIAMD
jgi:hypothetical protein